MIYELEVRLYGLFSSNLFISFLRKMYQDSLVDTLSDTVYLFPPNVRYIQYESEPDIIKMEKNIIMEKKFTDKKFSISTEFQTKSLDFKLKDSDSIRKRYREIYKISDNLDLHITKINNLKYEVEIEQEINIIEDDWEENNESILDSFQNNFDSFFEIIDNYQKEFKYFLDKFNGHHKVPLGTMSKSVIAKPRDIEKEDFITERDKGILRGLPEGYTLTIKGDGTTAILYFRKKSLFMIIPYTSFKIVKTIDKEINEEFMIIGEYMNKSVRSSEPLIFAPFDILYSSKHKLIPNHLERLKISYDILEKYSENIIGDSFKIFRKDFIPIGKTPTSFAKAYVKIKETKYPFNNDGMILTPTYYPQNMGLPKGIIRQISRLPEILKIKPWHELSIDFVVDISKKEVYTSFETTPYTGTFKFPFDSKVAVDWNSIPLDMDHKIVQLNPVKTNSELGFDLKFSNERTDKDTPNHRSIVDRVWPHLMNPLEEKVFLAKDISRLRFQNGRVKRNLINTIPKKSIVIDIGSGFGGDIFKYNNIADIVICTEPNDTNRKELLKRLNKARSTLKTKYEVLACKGEDTDIIMEAFKPIRNALPEANVVICSMLSLTFFWKNSETLNLFKRTLREVANYSGGALFYFFTVEGNRFKKYFEENDNKIKNSAMRAQYDPTAKEYGVGIPGRLKIEIFDTIVGGTESTGLTGVQREYLVELNDLKDTVSDLSFKDGKIEEYLTEDESKFAQCHVYGTARIN